MKEELTPVQIREACLKPGEIIQGTSSSSGSIKLGEVQFNFERLKKINEYALKLAEVMEKMPPEDTERVILASGWNEYRQRILDIIGGGG